MAKKQADSATPSFEESLAELEQIVARLEAGKLPLEDSLAAYELGVKRLAGCYQLLRVAERRIELVKSVDATGKPQTEPFEDAADEDLSAKSTARSRRRTAPPEGRGRSDNGSSLFS